MKKTIIISVTFLVFIAINSYAQDLINPPKLQNIDSSQVVYKGSLGFIRGWNWGSPGAQLDSSLGISVYHSMSPLTSSNYKDSIKDAEPIACGIIVGGRNSGLVFNAISLYLKPTIVVDSNDNSFTPRAGDSTGAVYGWYHRDLTVGDTAADFNRYILYANRVQNPDTVLYGIWDGSILRWEDYDGTDHGMPDVGRTNSSNPNDSLDMALYQPFNGKQFYVTINLRALNMNEVENHLNDTILILKLPYQLAHLDTTTDYIDTIKYFTYDYVKFDSIPQQSYAYNDTIYGSIDSNFRGISRKLTPAPNQPTDFVITGEMLKNLSPLSSDSSITLSAFAEFDGVCPGGIYHNNPRFKFDWWENRYQMIDFITNIDVQVIYYGKLDVGINYVRLETPRARDVFRGRFDDSVRKYVDTLLQSVASNSTHPKIARFYADDEIPPMLWAANRYYNMLVDTMAALETGVVENPPEHFLWATGFKEFWNGAGVGVGAFWNAAPFIRKGILDTLSHPEVFNLNFGYAGNNNQEPMNDTLNSNYESYLHGHDATIPINDSKIFEPNYNQSYGTLFQIEEDLYNFYYKNPKLIYNEKPWWINMWIIPGDYQYNSQIGSFTDIGARGRTGEEVRLSLNLELNLGAKGFIYWLKTTQGSIMNDLTIGFQPNSNQHPTLSGDALIYSDSLGGDYVKFPDANGFNNAFKSSAYNWNLMNIDTNHIYLGLKSMRAEINKQHKFIKACESSIMNMKLAAWYGHGFITIYSQDPQYGIDTLLKKFISLDSNFLYTKKNWNHSSDSLQFFREAFDSMFVDVCLHRDINVGMDSVFYIAVQSRRTDPLIRTCDLIHPEGQYLLPDTSYDCSMKFYSTAEFDDRARYGGLTINGNYHDANWWKQQWWLRLGVRELHIGFKYRYSVKSDNYTLLKITELGKGTSLDTNWWFQRPYNDVVDTIIQRDSSIVVRLLPGQGKIFKVQPLYSVDSMFTGLLPYSNQRKMAAYMINQDSSTQVPSDTATLRYHAVFFKPIETDITRLGVYYKRSKPMPAGVPVNQIDWEPLNYLLSDTVIIATYPPDTVKTRKCGYPSIVVRYDSLSTPHSIKVYVVYACQDLYAGSSQSTIIENEFDANGALSPSIKYGREIAKFHTDGSAKIIRWGTPTINASYNGNYIAWSDSSVGIVAGFQLPNQNSLTTKDTLHWFEPQALQIAQHPSLNTYSRLFSKDKNCALVWQEKNKDSTDDYFNIIYTRLRVLPNGKLIHYVPSYIPCDPQQQNFLGIYKQPDSTMVLITNTQAPQYYYYKYRYPMIYRGIEMDSLRDYASPHRHIDRIFWQGEDELNTDVVWIAGLWMTDDYDTISGQWLPDCWFIDGLSSIRSLSKSLYEPDAAQGGMMPNLNGKYTNDGDSIVITNFVSMPIGQQPNLSGKIWQVNSGYYGFFNDWQTLRGYFEDYEYTNLISSSGDFPHLAALPIITSDKSWQRNRRIFEADSSRNPPRIVSSLQWFYRKTEDEDGKSYPFFGFIHDSSKTIFSYTFLKENNGDIVRPFIITKQDDGISRVPIDTAYSDWFNVGDFKKMQFYGYGKGIQQINVFLERENDHKTYEVSTPVQGNKIIKNNFQLYNGGKNRYRMIYIKNIPSSTYTEELYIDGLPDLTDFENVIDYSKFGREPLTEQNHIIDLGDPTEQAGSQYITLSIYPNPADESIYATAYLPVSAVMSGRQHTMILKIYSSLGIELFNQEVNSGETISIQTQDYPQGAYFIRAEETEGNYSVEQLRAVVQGFVVKR